MSFELNSIFFPITATPKGSVGIKEIAPCRSLSRYVHCFWEREPTFRSSAVRIIPDFCCDIIIPLDCDGYGGFCGVSNRSFIAENVGNVFGIRFFAWAYGAFSDVAAEKLFNGGIPARELFEGFDAFETDIRAALNTEERVRLAQDYLLRLLISDNENSVVMNGLYYAVNNCCRVRARDLELYCAANIRTIERGFLKVLGTSPKHAVELLRYQMLWQDCISDGFDVLDSVSKYDYYDQAHLCNNFKRFHGIGISKARNEYKMLSHFYNTL